MFTDKSSTTNKDKTYDSLVEILSDDDPCKTADKVASDESNANTGFKKEAVDPDFEGMPWSEFKRDRDAIILSLQSALKARDDAKAAAIVLQYRFVTDIDRDFRRLAELAKSLRHERAAIGNILLLLDATPDDEHAIRYGFYQRLLKIEPANQSYKDGYLLEYRALNPDKKKVTAKRIKFINALRVVVVVGLLAFVVLSLAFFAYMIFSFHMVF